MLHKALKFAKSEGNGSRTISDRELFWERPRAWIGGEMLNRAGLQPVRYLCQHRPTTRHLPERLAPLGEEFMENGMVMIPNFLWDDAFEKVRREYDAAAPDHQIVETHTENKINQASGKYAGIDDAIQSAVISEVRQEAVKIDEERYPETVRNLIRHEDIRASIVSANPVPIPRPQTASTTSCCTRTSITPPARRSSTSTTIPRTTAPSWSFPRAIVSACWASVTSVDVARQKAGKSVSHPVQDTGPTEVFGQAFDQSELHEMQVVGGPNTLVVASVRAFHRRDGKGPEGARCMVRMSFRHVETLHHGLYPHLATPKAEKFRCTTYF